MMGSCVFKGRAEGSLCDSLPEALRRKLCSHARPLEVAAGDELPIGAFVNEAVLILEGFGFGGIHLGEGKSIAISVFGPGFIGNVARLLSHRRSRNPLWNKDHWAFAVTDVRGCAIPAVVLDEIVESDPVFCRMMLSQALDQYSMAMEVEEALRSSDVDGRIAWLDSTMQRYGADIFDLTHKRVGLILGMNRVTVTRSLASYAQFR